MSETWRYVVFDLQNRDAKDPVQVHDELHIKRGTTPVAKVRVTRVNEAEGLAVAEIRNIWSGQYIRRGDDVMY